MGLVPDESDDHAVEVEEEHDQVEAKLDEGFLFVYVELPEDLSRIKKMLVLENFLGVPGQQRQVEQQGDPVTVDEEEKGQEGVDGGLGNDVRVQAVAEVDRVDVVTFQIRVHDGEKHLEEEVYGIYEDREEVEPSLARHFGWRRVRGREETGGCDDDEGGWAAGDEVRIEVCC